MSKLTLIEEGGNQIDAIYAALGSREWLQALMAISRDLAQQGGKLIGMDNGRESTGRVVGIPRGGVPVGEAAAGVYPSSVLVFSNDGGSRDASSSLIQENDFIGAEAVLLGDGIIASGGTILRHINALVELGLDPRDIAVIAPIITELGIHSICADFPDVELVSAHIESEGAHVKFTENGPVFCDSEDSDAVFVIGKIKTDSMGDIIDIELGDFGDMFEQAVRH
ncbi:MAG: uracil phosphoribosyltransferase [Patescibacteria group bacterium]